MGVSAHSRLTTGDRESGYGSRNNVKGTLMALPSLRGKFAFRPSGPHTAYPPPPWPIDPVLGRRVTETRRRIERTRRQLARHVLPDRKRKSD